MDETDIHTLKAILNSYYLKRIEAPPKIVKTWESGTRNFILLEVTPKARQPLLLLCILSAPHVHTSGTKPAICLYVVSCNFLNGQPAKNTFPLLRQKTFLKKTKKGGMARDVTNRGGAFTRTTGTSKSPSEAFSLLTYDT